VHAIGFDTPRQREITPYRENVLRRGGRRGGDLGYPVVFPFPEIELGVRICQIGGAETRGCVDCLGSGRVTAIDVGIDASGWAVLFTRELCPVDVGSVDNQIEGCEYFFSLSRSGVGCVS
jgi:hypothetical protein